MPIPKARVILIVIPGHDRILPPVRRLLILLEVILLPQRRLRLLVLMREVRLEAGAEIDMPAPEPAEERLGVLVVVSAEFAV